MVESINITASIFSGNSGGCIIDNEGNVIGIVSAGIGDYETFSWGVSYKIAQPIVEKIINTRNNYLVGSIGLKLMLPNGYYAMETNTTSLIGFIVRESSISGIEVGDQIIKIDGDTIGPGYASLSEKILLNPNKSIYVTYRRNGINLYKWIQINEITINDDIPLGQFNHKLNLETKLQSTKHNASHKIPVVQRKQRRRGRPHRQLMLTTQE